MRVLFLTSHLPYPPYSGGRRREFELIRRIGSEIDLTIVAVSKTFDEDLRLAPALYSSCRSVHVFPAQPEPIHGDGTYAGVPAKTWRNMSAQAKGLVHRLLASNDVDVVHCEGYFMMPLLPLRHHAQTLIVEQNMDFQLLEQESKLSSDPEVNHACSLAADLAFKTAIDCWRRSSACGVLTQEDLDTVRTLAPEVWTFLLPDGFDHTTDLPLGSSNLDFCNDGGSILNTVPPDEPVLLFVANFAYQPNVDAAHFLVREILPTVLNENPRTLTILAGNSPTEELVAYDKRMGVHVTGRVKSLAPFYNRATLVVVPVRIGGGIKVKMLEAFAQGKACVTTSVGVQGLGGIARNCVVRDEPSAFARAVCHYLADEEGRRKLEEQARLATRELFTWQGASDLLLRSYEELIAAHSRDRVLSASTGTLG